jgi:hypothetical protein
VTMLEPTRWITARNVRGPLAAHRRRHHATAAVWSLTDTVLASPRLSNIIIVVATLGMAVACVWAGGLKGLVSGVSALSAIGGTVAGFIRMGRERRGVRPPTYMPCWRSSTAVRWRSVG